MATLGFKNEEGKKEEGSFFYTCIATPHFLFEEVKLIS